MRIKIAVLILGSLVTSQATAGPFTTFYTFGDSTVDSGWWKEAVAASPQCGPVAAPCGPGGVLDAKIASAIADGGSGAPVGVGQMNTQYLATDLGLTSIPANQPGGTNYAISGSLTATTSTGVNNLNSNPNLPSTITQLTGYLAANGNAANPGALYLLSSGGNDVTFAQNKFGTLFMTQADQMTFLAGQAASFASAIQTLQTDGAKYILVNGLQGSGTLATYYTSQLFTDLANLNVKFVGADIAGLIQKVENNPAAYNFDPAFVLPGTAGPVTDSACIAGDGAIGWGQFCGLHSSSEHSHLRASDSEMTSFWADDQHLSDAGQKIEANYELSLIEANFETPLPASLPLFAGGLGVLGMLARRRKRSTDAA